MPVARRGYALIIVPYNGKIADITHADTNKHTLDLVTALAETRKIISISVGALRIFGTGGFNTYPNEGVTENSSQFLHTHSKTVIILGGANRLQYKLTVANDDFDIYCFGYTVEA